MTDYVKSTNFASKDALAIGNPLKIVKGTEIDTEFNNIATAVATKADLNSPALLGTPTAPTPAAGNNTTLVATTAFVTTAVTNERSATATLTNKSLTSPTLTGVPVAPTASAGNNTTQVATTAFITTAVTNERSATATLTNKTLTSPSISSPTMTGTPVAPTAAAGTNTTQVATTAFVQAALQAVYPVGSVYINAASTTNPATLLGFGTWVEFGTGRVMVGQNASDALFDTLEETGGSKDAIVVSHTHTGSTNTTGAHVHSIPSYNIDDLTDPPNYIGAGDNQQGEAFKDTFSAGNHSHTFTTDSTGSSGTNANLPPYIVVKMWKRTA